MIITSIKAYDKKRKKISLEEGALCFLLYDGELRRLHLAEGQDLSEEDYQTRVIGEILLPRAKKRALYYLKNGDKTESQVVRKLKDGFYPQEVIDGVLAFLASHKFVDDSRYAQNAVESMKQTRSKREIAAKLYEKGIGRETVREQLEQIGEEDEYDACFRILKKQYGEKMRRAMEEEQTSAEETAKAQADEMEEGFSEFWEADSDSDADAVEILKKPLRGRTMWKKPAKRESSVETVRRQAYGFLARRGFSYDAIGHAFRQLEAFLTD